MKYTLEITQFCYSRGRGDTSYLIVMKEVYSGSMWQYHNDAYTAPSHRLNQNLSSNLRNYSQWKIDPNSNIFH